MSATGSTKKQEVKLMHRSQKFPSWINYSRLEMNFPFYQKKKHFYQVLFCTTCLIRHAFSWKVPKNHPVSQHQKELYATQSAPIKGYVLPLVVSYGTGHTVLSENGAGLF